MGVVSSPALVFVVVLVLATSVCAFDGYDGKPRPEGMDDKPTTTLGAKPAVEYLGKPANCIWYAWENFHYPPPDTKNCSRLLWEALTIDPTGLSGFMYYRADVFYDPGADEYLCVIGCFDLAASGPSSPPASPPTTPPVSSAPPPVTSAPPPVTSAPPPATSAPPPAATPPVMAPPPPATLFRPPPPGVALPPPSIVTPPTTGGPTQAPGPAAQTSGGSSLRVVPALIAAAAVLGFAI